MANIHSFIDRQLLIYHYIIQGYKFQFAMTQGCNLDFHYPVCNAQGVSTLACDYSYVFPHLLQSEIFFFSLLNAAMYSNYMHYITQNMIITYPYV